MRSRWRRPPRARCPPTAKIRIRIRLGSQRQAGPSGASICIQTSSSQARVMISHKIWFWTSLCRGRLRSPMSLAFRIRSSHRARRRCLSLRARVGRLGAGGEAGEPMAVDVGVP